MPNGSSFQDEISEMIAERKQKLRDLAGQVEAIQRDAEAIQQDIGGLTKTAKLYRKRHELSEPISPSELRGKTQLEALLFLCQMQGQFAVVEAKRLLRESGILTRGKNADSIIYTIIRRSERFEKVRPGVYKLRTQVVKPQVVKVEPAKIRMVAIAPTVVQSGSSSKGPTSKSDGSEPPVDWMPETNQPIQR